MRVVDDMDEDPPPQDTPPPSPPPSGYLNAITLSSLEKNALLLLLISHIHCKQRVFLRKCFLQVRKCIFTFIQDIIFGKDFFERN